MTKKTYIHYICFNQATWHHHKKETITVQSKLLGLRDWVIKRVSLGYIVGTNLSDAIHACKITAKNRWSITICPWHFSNDSAETVASNYMLALKSISSEKLDCYLSIKVWAFKYNMGMFKKILELAQESDIRVHFDSYDIESATPCFDLLEKALSIYKNISYTLPGRWKRSITDAERIIEFEIPVRLVKGEHVDPIAPDINLRDGFLDLIDVLAGRAKHVDVATHDTILAKKSLMRLQKAKTPCHLEQLYGLPLRTVNIAKILGVPIRIYIPYGAAYLGYGLSRVSKRPIILAWMIKDLLLGDKFRLPQESK